MHVFSASLFVFYLKQNNEAMHRINLNIIFFMLDIVKQTD